MPHSPPQQRWPQRPVAARSAARPCPVSSRLTGRCLSTAGHNLRSQAENALPALCRGGPSPSPCVTGSGGGTGGSGRDTIPSSRGKLGGAACGGEQGATPRVPGGEPGLLRLRFRNGPCGRYWLRFCNWLGRRPLHRSLGRRRRHEHDPPARPATDLPARKLRVNVEHVAGRTDQAKNHCQVTLVPLPKRALPEPMDQALIRRRIPACSLP